MINPVDLTDFLLARIAEDEAVARDAAGAPWVLIHWPGGSQVLVDPAAIREDQLRLGKLGHVATVNNWDGEHIARHDPDRVLAECDAKRRIVEKFRTIAKWANDGDDRDWTFRADGIADAMRLLALPYAGHPDYREEWKP